MKKKVGVKVNKAETDMNKLSNMALCMVMMASLIVAIASGKLEWAIPGVLAFGLFIMDVDKRG
tara:strand:- start:18327 stop:18515 length:189 start_codon:yes stop_codon:yes gene_type:complete